ncbi:competence protein ComG [Bacillus methanolicus]|uniref:competence type IV pilus minor pilin ComGD n=1 Tax=Bacillus methanolicus TaxID=1471 RepID=UPI00238036FF|nr:competence type IV pilus minor pilin ComGD [Bacillus methanolicus]MDE3839579.1 competence protein ComG [Bacillus methanolicus]
MRIDEKGFTLAEILLVLSIFLIVSSIAVFSVKPHYHFIEKTLFFTRLKADLYYAQQYAISQQRQVQVHFLADEHRYFVHDYLNGKIIIDRSYSKLIKVREGSLKLSFKFTYDGRIDRFGSIYITIGKEIYRMTFLLGEGRFYVAKDTKE